MGRSKLMRTRLLAALLIALFVFGTNSGRPTPVARAASSEGISHIYDAAGRLSAVVDPNADAAVYNYDQVGNVTSITRYPASTLSVLGFSPSSGGAGTAMLIRGTGFAAGDQVSFGGVIAAAQVVSSTQITTNVPAAATTGKVTVTGGASTATSSAVFTFNSLVQINSFSPAGGGPDTPVTISGANFDPSTITNDSVMFNHTHAIVTAVSATSITALVPPGTNNGLITVITPHGVGVSRQDFIVQAGVVNVNSFSLNGSASVAAQSPGAAGAVLFDATQGQKVAFSISYQASSGGCCAGITLTDPHGGLLLSYNGGWADPILLPITGTYSVTAVPQNPSTGTMTVKAWSVPADASGTLSLGGGKAGISSTVPGQNMYLTFSGTAGQKVAGNLTSNIANGQAVDVALYNPDGTTNSGWAFGNGTVYVDATLLPQTGTYKLYFNPRGDGVGTESAQFW
ncbi:MAG TPA: IPT/TIG domain-containing protein, partial [Candidatus Dormibacteraeota bacterium]|nr:IPT/TIG domain-containing protein [Candidatus Dormibacteraeota bacterium]